jgi:hypothetical protein
MNTNKNMRSTLIFLLLTWANMLNAQENLTITDLKLNFKQKASINREVSIKFPFASGGVAAAAINDSLHALFNLYFRNFCNGSIEECIEDAINIGLDSVSYTTVSTDTTISIVLEMFSNFNKSSFDWQDYLTFSKKSGKRLSLEEMFPNVCVADLYNYLMLKEQKLWASNFEHIKYLYRDKKMPYTDYDILYSMFLRDIPNYNIENFIMTKETIYLKQSYRVQKRLLNYLLPHLIIPIEEMQYDLNANR